jgi:hypothetical protein
MGFKDSTMQNRCFLRITAFHCDTIYSFMGSTVSEKFAVFFFDAEGLLSYFVKTLYFGI